MKELLDKSITRMAGLLTLRSMQFLSLISKNKFRFVGMVPKGVIRMSNDIIKEKVLLIVKEYPVKRVVLFGSRAEETNQENSDVDLIMEFYEPISLFTLSDIRLRLEEILGLEVDIIHGPIREGDLIEVGKEIELYVA